MCAKFEPEAAADIPFGMAVVPLTPPSGLSVGADGESRARMACTGFGIEAKNGQGRGRVGPGNVKKQYIPVYSHASLTILVLPKFCLYLCSLHLVAVWL